VELLAVEFGFDLSYLLTVCIHLLLGAIPVFVDLLDDNIGVAIS
jgi:hypothetical protein